MSVLANSACDLAPRVCAFCRRRKKKCGKELPTCHQCARHGVQCGYEEDLDETSAREEVKILRDKLKASEGHLIQLSRHNNIQQHSFISAVYRQTMLSYSTWPNNLLLSQPTLPDHNRLISQQVADFLEISGQKAPDICQTYFETIHKWLPIISRRKIVELVSAPLWRLRADSALLILCMYLITRLPEQRAYSGYRATKSVYNQVNAFLPPSIPLVQSGLLIVTFEHLQGHSAEAYISMNSCAAATRAIGLNKEAAQHAKEPAVEERNLWWGCVLRDLYLHLERDITGRLLCMEAPESCNVLPVECEDWDDIEEEYYDPIVGLQITSKRCESKIRSFGMEAQAAVLHRRILDLSQETSLDFGKKRAEVAHIDHELQRHLSLIIQLAGETFGIYCGALSMTFESLFIIHQAQFQQSDDVELSSKSLLVLKTLTRIISDIITRFNSHATHFNVVGLPPSPPHCGYMAANVNILLARQFPQYRHGGQWVQDHEAIRANLSLLRHRWKISEQYLKIIDAAFMVTMGEILVAVEG